MASFLRQRSVIAIAAVATLLLSACSQTANPTAGNQPAAPAAPPELVTAKTAFWPMYKAALTWNGDAETLRVSAKEIPGFKNQAGKAAMWEASFGSPSNHQYRVYTYSIAAAPPDIHKGVASGIALPWAGQTREAMPIDATVFNVDSDAAYRTSAADAAAWLAKNQDKPLSSVELGNTYGFKSPVWYVAWGDKKSGYIALVNATSGTLYKKK
ncbi:MAG TPA: hypothetical protein VGN01_09090 [Acidobacteriaceae bacterium]|jgi:hypothetical protein